MVLSARALDVALGILFAAWPICSQSVNLPQFRTTKVQEPPGKTSVDLLRHPINDKTRELLKKALQTMNSGDHEAAIKQLLEILAKYPESAAYVCSMVGIEYIKTERYREAIDVFEQAVDLLPHDAVNRYNLGLSYVFNGEAEKGAQEVRRALKMDPGNPMIRAFLEALSKAHLIAPEGDEH